MLSSVQGYARNKANKSDLILGSTVGLLRIIHPRRLSNTGTSGLCKRPGTFALTVIRLSIIVPCHVFDIGLLQISTASTQADKYFVIAGWLSRNNAAMYLYVTGQISRPYLIFRACPWIRI
jgi:hypothetical protein